MKKMKSMRVAAVLLALVMITSCFVGNTFAKYVSSGGGEATARVAKFGVVVGADASDVFKTSYAKEDSTFTGTYSVSAGGTNPDYVVAPGTTSDAIEFSVTGVPEVAVNVDFSFGNDPVDVFLGVGTYTDDTTADITDSFELTADYYPVKFTLTQTTASGSVNLVENGTLADVADKLENLNQSFNPGDDLENELGSFSLTWVWNYDVDDVSDKADTLLGNLAAELSEEGYASTYKKNDTTGDITYGNVEDYSTTLSFEFKISVTQIN